MGFWRWASSLASLILVIFAMPTKAFATAGVGVTYHGRLLKPDGSPVTSNSVQFRVQIRTPGAENCLMYEETYTKDLSGSSGAFAITLNDGTATSLNTEPFNFDRIFQNRGTFSFAGGKCTAVGSYVPNAADGRRMAVDFNDGSFGGWETLPVQDIAFVPMAIESMTVGGYNADSLLRVVDVSGNPASATPLSPAQYTEFGNLLSGASTQYVHAGANSAGFTGSLAGDVTGTQGATSVGKLLGRVLDTTPPSNGQVLTWNNISSRWEPTTPASTGVTNVATGTGLSGGPITGTGTISLANTSVVAGGYGSSTQVPTFTVDAQGRLTTASNVTISGVAPGGAASGDLTGTYPGPTIATAAVTGSKIANNTIGVVNLSNVGASTGQSYRYSGAAWTISKLSYTDLVNSFSSSPWPTVTCSSGQFIIWQSTTDSFVCSALTSSQITTALGYTAANGASYVAKAGDTMTGSLGIGTTSATTKLDVVGTLKVADGGETCTIAGNGGMIRYSGTSLQYCNGSSWQTLGTGSGGVTGVTAGTGLTGGTITTSGTIGLGTELTGVNSLSTTGFVKRTGAGAYSTATAIALSADVSGTLPIANGGTGQTTATAAFNALSPLTTKGDLVVRDGSNNIRLAVGADGKYLKADSAQASGLAWSDVVATDLTSLSAVTGIIQRTGANTYSAVAVNSPLAYSAGALSLGVGAGGVLMDGGNITAATVKVGTKDANDLSLITNNTVKMTVQSGGNVGIGTATPGYKLDVNGQVNGSQICVAGDCRSAWPAAGSVSSVPLVTKLTATDLAASGFTAGVDFTPNFNTATINNLGGANLAADRVDIPSDGMYEVIASAYYCPQTSHYTSTRILVNGSVVISQGSPVASGCRTDTAITVLSLTAGQNVSMSLFDSVNGPSMGIFNIQLSVTKLNSHGTTNLADADGNTKVEVERSANDDTVRIATAGTDRVTVLATGNVGIGSTAPVTKLDLVGTLKVGDGGETCSIAGNGGMIRYSGTSLQYCNGTSWQTLGGGAVTSITAGTGLTGGTISSSGTIGLGTELTGLNGLSTTGFVKRTGAGAYSTATSVALGTDVSGTLPIANGGTGQTTAIAAFNALSPLTTKGDLLVRDGTNNIRLPTAVDGKFLKTDSAQASGLAWSDVVATDLSSMVSTGIVQRNGSNSYSSVTVNSPLTYSAGSLGISAAAGGVLMDGGNTAAATVKVGTKDANDLSLITNNTVKMTVQSGGNVGIGTTIPGQLLTVAGMIESTSGGLKFPDGSIQTSAAGVGATAKAALIGKSTAQGIAASTTVLVNSFDAVAIYDTGGFWSAGTPDRLTVPSGVTRVRVTAAMNWANNTSGLRYLTVYKNGTTIYLTGAMSPVQAVSNPVLDPQGRASLSSPVIDVSPGDYFQLYVHQQSGAALNLNSATLGIEAVNGSTVSSGGSGTANYIPQWTSANDLGNSPLFNLSGNVGIGTTSPAATLDVNGSITSKGPAGEASLSSFTAASGGMTDLTGFTVDTSVGGGFTSGTGVFQPTVAGRYLFTFYAYSGASNSWIVSVLKNGVSRVSAATVATVGIGYLANGSVVISLNGSTDTVKFQIGNYSGSTVSGTSAVVTWTKLP